MSFASVLRAGLDGWGIPYSAEQLTQLEHFSRLLVEKNKVMNLTAITDPEEIARRHMLDSLFLLTLGELGTGRVIDIGTGAGFPGLPLKILQPAMDLTLLDATGKRIAFIRDCADTLGLSVAAIQGRAEELVRQAGMREAFSAVLSRAVAPLNILCELCLPYLAPGGAFLAMKSANEATEQEILSAERAISQLGGRLECRRVYPLAALRRQVLVIRKLGPTPKEYPRRYGKITAKPL